MTDPRLPHHLVELAREVQPDDHVRLTPPDEIWAGIDAAMATEPVSLASRRRWSGAPAWLLAAAAVIAVVGVIGLLARWADDSNETVVAMTSITSAGLQLEGPDGTARLVDTGDGLELELELATLPDADGFYEVWIIDTDVAGMFSLGVVDPDGDGRFALPDGVDPGDYPVVDISAEPIDGDPTHSGQSILRGVLEL